MFPTASKIRSDVLAVNQEMNLLEFYCAVCQKIFPASLYMLIAPKCGTDKDDNDKVFKCLPRHYTHCKLRFCSNAQTR